MNIAKLIMAVVVLFFSYEYNALAFKEVKGKEALEYIGDIKSKFTNGEYSYEILKRNHRDSMNARASDALIFNKQGNKFHYVRRRDSDHDIILNHPEGRIEDPATAEPHVWKPIANTLQDDHPKAHVFFDNNNQEIATVFIGPKTQLKGKLEDGLLRLRIKVKGVKKRKHGARGM